MSGEIHSVQFYEIIAKSKADGNHNGVIDKNEESLYNAWMQYFNRDSNPEITEEDVAIYRQEATYTDDEKNILKEEYSLMARDNLTYEESRKLSELDDKIDLLKRHEVNSFSAKAETAIEYMRALEAAGKLDELGISAKDIRAYEEAYEKEYKMDFMG
ncbi:aldo/keto reductase [bacterium]|nr:aldo/keto reductase [bacterium]